MIVGILILAALIVLVVFLARNMMPARTASPGDVDDLTTPTAYTADHSSHCGDHSVDGDCGGGH